MRKIQSLTIIFILLISGMLGGLGPLQNHQELDTASAGPANTISANGDVKQKTIYLHNNTGTVNTAADVLTMNTTMGNNKNTTDWDKATILSYDWYLDPPFAGNFSLNGTAKLSVWMVQKDATGATNVADFTMTLYDVDPAGTETDLGFHTIHYDDVRTTFSEYSVSGNYTDNISAGHSLHIELQIGSNNQVGTSIGFGDSEFPSRLELETDTYMQLESMSILDYTYEENYSYLTSATNKTIHFNATVTDPFGGYDIWDVQLTIMDPNGTAVLDGISMTRALGTNASFSCNYTYAWDYSNATEGQYTAIISAIDQTGYNYRYPDHPDDETYGGHLDSLQKNFWIGVERFDVHFKTVDSLDLIMSNATVEIRSLSDVYIISNNTNASGITKIGLSNGDYTVLVHWQGITVNVTTYEVTGEVTAVNAVVLNCSVYYPTYRVVDVAYENVSSANLFIGHPNGTLLTLITGAEGTAGLSQMAAGEYEIRTEWLGKVVNTTDHSLSSNDEFTIEASIFYLTVTTRDGAGVAVPDVLVTVTLNDTGRIADAKLTDAQGNMTARLPGTQSGFGYDLTCQWHGVYVGAETNVSLTQNESINITLEIYYVDFHTFDSMGLDLEYTRLLAFTNETDSLANTAETNITGDATMRLPGGNHTLEAYWKGIHVGTHYFVVSNTTGQVNITCSVYHVTFSLTDSRGIALENAQLTVKHADAGTLASNVTDANGEAKARLPGTTVGIEVHWRGVPVYSDDRVIDSNGAIDIQCGVYYLSVLAVDDLGQPLESANIEYIYGGTLLASDMTADNGTTGETRLPGAALTIRASWKGIVVYDDAYTLDANGQAVLNTTVYHVEIEVLDSLDEAISGATVGIYHGGVLLFNGLTGDDGTTWARLPGETHNFRVTWKGVLVFDSDITVSQSGTITLHVDDVFHVTFQLLDSQSEYVAGARVVLEVGDVQIASGTTDDSGMYSARVPTPVGAAGDIDIIATWKGIEVHQETVQIESNYPAATPMVLNVAVYYIDYTILDQREAPVEGAVVTDTHSELPAGDDVIDSELTDANGTMLFRLPGGAQTLDAHWEGILINSTSVYLNEDMSITCNASVYYLDVNVKDADGAPVGDSLIRITYPGGQKLYQAQYADTEGYAEFRIPASEWHVEITWLDTVIYDEGINVTGDDSTWTLDAGASVYYLTVKTMAGDEPLSGVHVIVQGGQRSWSGYTENGEVTFRLPQRDDYTINARLMTTYMLSDVELEQSVDIDLQGSAEETLDFESYPPSLFSTNLFLLVLGFVILLGILAFLYHRVSKEDEIKEESPEEDESTPLDSEDKETEFVPASVPENISEDSPETEPDITDEPDPDAEDTELKKETEG